MDFANLNVVDVLNTGVSGFSFLMLLIGYRLVSQVQERVSEVNMSASNNIELFRERKGLVIRQLNTSIYFMVFAGAIFAGGLVVLVYQMIHQAESEVLISVTPWEGSRPEIMIGELPVEIDSGRNKRVLLKTDATMFIKNDKLHRLLNAKQLELENAKNQLGNLVVKQTTETNASEVGF